MRSENDVILYSGEPHTVAYTRADFASHGLPESMAQQYIDSAPVIFDASVVSPEGHWITNDEGRHIFINGPRIIHGERVTSPTCPGCKPYTPNPHVDHDGDGITDAARVGVPGKAVPPPPARIPRLPNLTEGERDAETRFADAFERDPDGIAKHYTDEIATKNSVATFATDDAKALSGDYNPQGEAVTEADVKSSKATYNLAVHQTANAIAKRAFVQYLDDVVSKLPEDKRSVLVTCGGVASGKDFAIGKIGEVQGLKDQVGAIWNAAGEQNATENPWILDECRKRGIRSVFVYVHNDPSSTWENPSHGVIKRAIGSGRMVDALLFADSYDVGGKNMQKFYEQNKGAKDIDFVWIDNTGSPKIVNELPKEAASYDSAKVYARSLKYLKIANAPPPVLRGGSLSERIWGPPKEGRK